MKAFGVPFVGLKVCSSDLNEKTSKEVLEGW
jgi:hypothetical protein